MPLWQEKFFGQEIQALLGNGLQFVLFGIGCLFVPAFEHLSGAHVKLGIAKLGFMIRVPEGDYLLANAASGKVVPILYVDVMKGVSPNVPQAFIPLRLAEFIMAAFVDVQAVAHAAPIPSIMFP